jgi:Flp pilus assembly protein CpaB
MATEKKEKLAADEVLSDIAGLADKTADAFRRGSMDAKQAAEQAIPNAKNFMAKGVFVTSYYLAFGAVYSAEVIKDMLPSDSVVIDGFREGAKAAHEARARYLANKAARAEQAGEAMPA